MDWKLPPKIKVHEALGCLVDGRIEVVGNTAKVYSSSGNKYYDVVFEPTFCSIMSNDNGSYWQGYLGYPSIAMLMVEGVISYDKKIAQAFKGIAWKDVNTKFKNDFAKTEEFVLEKAQERGFDKEGVMVEVDRIFEQIKNLKIGKFGKQTKPPGGY